MKVNFAEPDSWETVSLESICKILDFQRIPVNLSERNKRIKGKNQISYTLIMVRLAR